MTKNNNLVIEVCMPRIFSEHERVEIIDALEKAAMEELKRNGIRRTTVDSLCSSAHIAKGTFYLFYESKEELFLSCLTSFAESLEGMYLEMLQNLDENHIVTSLTAVFYKVAERFEREGIFRFLDGENLALIKRKVPEKRFRDPWETMDKVIHSLFQYFSIENEEDIHIFEDSFLSIIHLYLIPQGLRNRDESIKFLIRGLVLQMVE